MADEYIKRSDAIEAMKNNCPWERGEKCRGDCLMCEQDAINNIPAADVVEVRHGHWRDTGSGQECSLCKEIQYGYDNGRRYCQNCGAVMDESEGEE